MNKKIILVVLANNVVQPLTLSQAYSKDEYSVKFVRETDFDKWRGTDVESAIFLGPVEDDNLFAFSTLVRK